MTDHVRLAWYSYRAPDTPTSDRLLVAVDYADPLWNAYDVCDALEIHRDHIEDPDTAPHFTVDGEQTPFIPTDQVRTLAGGQHLFLARVEWILGCVMAARRSPLPRTTARLPRETVDLVDVRADTFTIALAARILDRDPAITIGRDALFDEIRRLQMVTKDADGAFIPTVESTALGILARNDIWLRSSKIAFNKIRITPAGLEFLHTRLGGTATIDVDAPAAPTLVDVP